jgi:hypothetical protein
MKGFERVSGFSLSKELASLAEFRLHTAEKLRLIEKVVSGIRSVTAERARSGTNDPTKRYGTDHDPTITRYCLQLLVASESPLTIGQICTEVKANVNLGAMAGDPLHLVCKSLLQLASIALAVPVERLGVRKWAATGSQPASGAEKVSTQDIAAD